MPGGCPTSSVPRTVRSTALRSRTDLALCTGSAGEARHPLPARGIRHLGERDRLCSGSNEIRGNAQAAATIILLGDVSRIRSTQDEFVGSALSTLPSQASDLPGRSVADAALGPLLASDLADDALLALISRGDTRAFEIIYERHCGPAFSLAHRLCSDRATAEEVSQDAFLALWRTARSYDALRGSCRTWILVIVRHRAIDALRRGARHAGQRASDEGLEERVRAPLSTEDEVTRREQRKEVQEALRELPAAQRRVIELAFFGGLSHAEIASLLGDPIGTVKGRMRLALTKLRPLVHGTAPIEA